MVDPAFRPIPSPAVSAVPAPSSAPNAGQIDAETAARGARFQALLEQLDLRSREVAKSAQQPLSAQDLPGALEGARSSLEGALQIGQDLLEAVRQSSAQASQNQSRRS